MVGFWFYKRYVRSQIVGSDWNTEEVVRRLFRFIFERVGERFYDDNKPTLEDWLRQRFEEAIRQTFGPTP